MRDSEYVERIRRHLGEYRESVLGVPAGTWGKVQKPYAHILPSDAYRLNVVEPIRESFWRTHAAKGWKCHALFHHLSSSQALAFNLFFPVYPRVLANFGTTRGVLQIDSDAVADLDFEVVLRHADGSEIDGTNIDVLITDGTGTRTIIEVKLTESRFGSARSDKDHLQKLTDVYRPLLEGRLPDRLLQPVPFFRDYQLFRQLAQIRQGSADRVLLLLPRARPELWRFANEWCANPDLGEFCDRVRVVALEDIATGLRSDARAGDHDMRPYEALVAKYLF